MKNQCCVVRIMHVHVQRPETQHSANIGLKQQHNAGNNGVKARKHKAVHHNHLDVIVLDWMQNMIVHIQKEKKMTVSALQTSVMNDWGRTRLLDTYLHFVSLRHSYSVSNLHKITDMHQVQTKKTALLKIPRSFFFAGSCTSVAFL